MKLSLNISPCPNDTFMFDALVNGRIDTKGIDFELTFADIEELNKGVIDGLAVISKVSCAVLPLVADRYAVLDAGSALGRGNGPLLVSRDGGLKGIDSVNCSQLGGRDDILLPAAACGSASCEDNDMPMAACPATRYHESAASVRHDIACPLSPSDMSLKIAVPGENTTANMLMDKIFPRLTNKEPMLFSDIAQAVADGRFDAGVLIHEGRFTYAEKGLRLEADLGVEWDRLTGLPLPLGAIVVSRELPAELQRKVGCLLRKSIEFAFANPEAGAGFVRSHAQELSPEVLQSHIYMFVNDYSLSLGVQGREAIKMLTGLDDKIFV